MRPPPEEGASRLPNTGSASAYPCAEDIIARFVEFGKMGEKPRRGDSVPPSCHCEEGQSPDVAIRPPPSQSAALTAPPEGEPRGTESLSHGLRPCQLALSLLSLRDISP